MRFTAFIACLLVAFDCAQVGAGRLPQDIFAGEWVWLWWLSAGAWLVAGFRILLEGAR